MSAIVNGGQFGESKGKVNAYSCVEPICEFQRLFTLNMACGVTPAMIPCPNCRCMMPSSVYKLRMQLDATGNVDISHIWYRPVMQIYPQLTQAERSHVLSGGLLFGRFPDDCIRNADIDFIGCNEWKDIENILRLYYRATITVRVAE